MADTKLDGINTLILENLTLLGYETKYPSNETIYLKKNGKTRIVSKEEILMEIAYSTGYLDYLINNLFEK